MLNTENAVIEILPGKVDDSTAREVYRNLQVLYGTCLLYTSRCV